MMTLTYFMSSIAFGTAALAAPGKGGSVTIVQPADFKTEADALLQASYPADGPGVAVIVTPTRVASWDHSKMSALPGAGS